MQSTEAYPGGIINFYDLYWPAIFLSITAVIIIILSLFRVTKSWVFFATIAGIVSHLLIFPGLPSEGPWTTNVIDAFTNDMKTIVGLASLVTVVISGRKQRMEYYLMILSVLIGAELLMVSPQFIMILLSLELISISSYVLVAGTDANRQRAEAAWKFFLFGSVATAVMIFGITYLYGATGEISIHTLKGSPLNFVGGIMLLSGFLFKMSSAPFHLWAPDVYEAAPVPVVAFLSVVPKLAGFTIVMNWLGSNPEGWPAIIAVFAILTIIIGTLAAISQSNAKRMMAYSSIAQAGFLLIVPVYSANVHDRLSSFYALIFAIANFVVFAVIHQQEKSGRGTNFSDFNGIGYTNPFAAVAVTLGLLSLAGIPPVAGLMAKLFVFSGVWTKYISTGSPIFISLFVIGLLATVASLFFYLKIPFYAFLRRSEGNEPIKIPFLTNLLLVILVGLLLALFFAPGIWTS
ncbi:MAG: NADH-quinone oxidoreductase subunit N [Bacteroidota bacterium]